MTVAVAQHQPQGTKNDPKPGPAGLAVTPRAAAGQLLLVSRIPGGPAPDYAPGNPAPFSDLTLVRARPVHGHGGKAPLFSQAGETQPPRAELGSDSAPRPRIGAAVPEHSLLDEIDGVLDGSASFHFPAFNRRRMDHPYLPDSPSCVEERAIPGVFRGLELQWNPWPECVLVEQNVNHGLTRREWATSVS
jgi:hypothetical protein